MIYEQRTYTLQPGKQPEYLKLNAEVGRKIRGDKYGKFEGGWTTEFGTLNQYVHLWSYPDLNEREAARAKAVAGHAGEASLGKALLLLMPVQAAWLVPTADSRMKYGQATQAVADRRAPEPCEGAPTANKKMPETLEIGYGGSERLTMNMGPQHPSAHGVFRAILTLEGETVVGVDAVIGYLHRCHEKLGETLTYAQYPSIASKTDYVAAMTAELAYVSAVELVGKIEVPRRAQWLRVLAAELQRVASHCLWLGTWCMDMGGALGGGATVFLYAIREREDVLDLFEALTGARLLYGFHQPGGTRYDLPAGWTAQCRKTLDHVEQRIGEYEAMLEENAFFRVRTQGVGVISRELAQEMGVSGPLLRGSGIDHDLRKAAPYSPYEHV